MGDCEGDPPTKDGYDGIPLRPNPEKKANILSRMFFWYVTPIFVLGYKKKLEFPDLFKPLQQHDSETATEDLTRLWKEEQISAERADRGSSMFRTVFKFIWKKLLVIGIVTFIGELLVLVQPICMGRLIRYFRFNTTLTAKDAYIAAGCITVINFVLVGLRSQYFWALQKLGMRTKIATSGMIVEKGFRLSSQSNNTNSIGHVVNLLSTDVLKFDTVFLFTNYFWISPILFILYLYVIWSEIGVAAFAGFGALIILFVLQTYFSHISGIWRLKIAVRTDKRVSLMNEVLNGIRFIKMNAWEDVFLKKVGYLRRIELNRYRWYSFFQAVVTGIFASFSKLVILPVALCYVYTGNDLTAEKIFVASALFGACQNSLMHFLPWTIEALIVIRTSCHRIQNFLSLDEYTTKNVSMDYRQSIMHLKTEELSEMSNFDNADTRVELTNYTTSWTEESDDVFPVYAIKNVTLNAHRGQLIGIVGPVGCGKSSLLASILRETRRIDGNLTIKGTIAYCSQAAWIFGGTIRENILFGREMDRALYAKALEYSSLLADLGHIPSGDKAIVGDRGTSLSGGQRARVALARAIYSDADIYLLDDPLSAVDAKVGREIFENCISKFLRNRTVILVTHQIQFLGQVDQIVLMKGGEVVGSGTPRELKQSNPDLFSQIIKTALDTEKAQSNQARETRQVHTVEKIPLEETQETTPEKKEKRVEYRVEGSVHWSMYWKYVLSLAKNPIFLPPTLFIVVFVQLLFNATDYWLSKWTNAAERASDLMKNGTIHSKDEYIDHPQFFFWQSAELSLREFQNVFIIMTALLVLLAIVRCLWIKIAQTVSSEILHKKMSKSVFGASTTFFEEHPVGRILNRFSKDVYILDEQLAYCFHDFTMGFLSLLGFVVLILTINPYVLLVTLPLIIIILIIRNVYLATSQDAKRLDAVSRSTVYAHISAIMDGLVTVRAYSMTNKVVELYHAKMNVSMSAFFLDIMTGRWFSTSNDLIVSTFVSLVAFAAVVSPAVFTSSQVALMLLSAIDMSGVFSWILGMSADLQNNMVSLERIDNYSELPSEFEEDSGEQEPHNWPSEGSIIFDHLYLKYTDEIMVLKDLCFSIKGKEKIGIVGRTGAGKSSLLRAIFRLTPPFSGRILIDGVDISTIPLKTLRSSLAIIPQEPVLFVGTVRYNIDPFEEHNDEQLWDALSQVKMKDFVQLSGGLDASMQEGGSNFSVGQRQLICLARAILRKAKILVIDEATANVDQQTDHLIQATIRDRFRDSTVLTIAHRLNTIMDSDRILVLEDGRVKEFDTPHRLLNDKNSLLNSLL